jgi:transmembrane sensor
MGKRDFGAALREADRSRVDRTLSPQAERRLRARFEEIRSGRERKYSPWRPLALASAVAVGAFLGWLTLSRPHLPANGTEHVGDFSFASAQRPAVTAGTDGALAVATGGAQLRDEVGAISIDAREGAQVRREPGGLRILSGVVTLDVRKRRPGEPRAVILVSHGAIEVMGTRFTITQGSAGGNVVLHEGSIRFRSNDGRVKMLVPGETLSWPLPPDVAERPEPSPPVAAAAPAPSEVVENTPEPATSPVEIAAESARNTSHRKPLVAGPEIGTLIEEIGTLRRLGRFDEAATRLQGALGAHLPSSTRERLSYELGSILTWQLRDSKRACGVWRAHMNAWPNGRYSSEVNRASRAVECPAP